MKDFVQAVGERGIVKKRQQDNDDSSKNDLKKQKSDFSSSKPCFHFANSSCSRGKNCNFSHDVKQWTKAQVQDLKKGKKDVSEKIKNQLISFGTWE